ncbi:hypothetical protein ACLB2K_061147 [Fragaria x ananassa]
MQANSSLLSLLLICGLLLSHSCYIVKASEGFSSHSIHKLKVVSYRVSSRSPPPPPKPSAPVHLKSPPPRPLGPPPPLPPSPVQSSPEP